MRIPSKHLIQQNIFTRDTKKFRIYHYDVLGAVVMSLCVVTFLNKDHMHSLLDLTHV